jgi:hypothetical protein
MTGFHSIFANVTEESETLREGDQEKIDRLEELRV